MPEVSTENIIKFNDMTDGQRGLVVSGRFIPLQTSSVGVVLYTGEYCGVEVDFSGKVIQMKIIHNRRWDSFVCVIEPSKPEYYYRPVDPEVTLIEISA